MKLIEIPSMLITYTFRPRFRLQVSNSATEKIANSSESPQASFTRPARMCMKAALERPNCASSDSNAICPSSTTAL